MKMMRGIKETYAGLLSPGAALAKPGESKGKVLGHALLTTATGAAVGTAVGIADGTLHGGVTAKQLAAAAGAALIGSMVLGTKPAGRHLSNVNAALSALAAREYSVSKTAHVAGTADKVLSNQAKKIAAHGEGPSFGGDFGADHDPLVTEGARLFGT